MIVRSVNAHCRCLRVKFKLLLEHHVIKIMQETGEITGSVKIGDGFLQF